MQEKMSKESVNWPISLLRLPMSALLPIPCPSGYLLFYVYCNSALIRKGNVLFNFTLYNFLRYSLDKADYVSFV